MSNEFNFSLSLRKLIQDTPNYIGRTQSSIERLENIVEELDHKVFATFFNQWVGLSSRAFSDFFLRAWMGRMNQYINTLKEWNEKFNNEIVPAAEDINTKAMNLVNHTDVSGSFGLGQKSIISLNDSELENIRSRIGDIIDGYYMKLEYVYQIECLVYNLVYESFIDLDEIRSNRQIILNKMDQLNDLDHALGKYQKAVGEFEEMVSDYMDTIITEDAKVITADNYDAYRIYVPIEKQLPATVPEIYNSERFQALLEMDPRLVSQEELAILTGAFSGLVKDNGEIDIENMEKFLQQFYVKSEEPMPEEFMVTGVPTYQTNLSPLFTLMYANYMKNDMQLVYNVNGIEYLSLSEQEQNQYKKTLLVNSLMQNVVYHMPTLELIYGDPSAEQFHELPNIQLEKYSDRNAYDYRITGIVPDSMYVGGRKTEITMYAYAENSKCLDQNISDVEVEYINKNMPGVSDYLTLAVNSGVDLSGVLDAIPLAGQAKTIIDLFTSIEENRTAMKESLIAKDNEDFENVVSGLDMVGSVSVVDGKLEFNYYTPSLEDYTIEQYVEVYNDRNQNKGQSLDAEQVYKDFEHGDYDSENIKQFILFITDGNAASFAKNYFNEK